MYTADDLKLLSDQFMDSDKFTTGFNHNIGLMIKRSNYCFTQLSQHLRNFDKLYSEAIYSIVLRNPLKKIAKIQELPGEGIYFVIFDHYNYLNLEFCKRHLVRLLTKAPLDDMPLLLDIPVVMDIAKWRLEIGK